MFSELKNGSFEGGVFSKGGLQALGRIGVSAGAGAGALGGGLGTAVAARIGSVGLRVATNTGGSAAIGAASETANQIISGEEISASDIGRSSVTSAIAGLGGSGAGEAIEAGGNALANVVANKLPIGTRSIINTMVQQTEDVARTSQIATPGSVTLANISSTAINNVPNASEALSCPDVSSCE